MLDMFMSEGIQPDVADMRAQAFYVNLVGVVSSGLDRQFDVALQPLIEIGANLLRRARHQTPLLLRSTESSKLRLGIFAGSAVDEPTLAIIRAQGTLPQAVLALNWFH